jgi:small subunit ribosomal protein S16
MSVKIRLTRMGKKKQPTYRVVVMDSRKPRDGAYLEQIGRYDPRQEPSIVEIDNERALDWLMKGAQPTERARKLLEISGAWMQFRVAKGDVYTVGDTDAAAAPAVETPASEAPAPVTPPPVAPDHTPEVHVVGDPLPADEPGATDEESPAAAGASPEEPSDDEASSQPEDTTDAAAEATADDKEES